jgi:hypothetical protein
MALGRFRSATSSPNPRKSYRDFIAFDSPGAPESGSLTPFRAALRDAIALAKPRPFSTRSTRSPAMFLSCQKDLPFSFSPFPFAFIRG